MMINEGDIAPDFTLKADDGKDVSLSDYKGKKVVLYFYPKDGTSGCTKEAINFRDAIEEFQKERIVILGLSKDSVDSHKKFKEKFDLPFKLLSDPEVKVLDQYGVWKKKSMFGKSFMGTERTTFLIDENGRVKKIYRKVKVKRHAQACLQELT